MIAPRTAASANPDLVELVFYDADNPRCVVNLLTNKLKENALKLPPHLLARTSKELEKHFEPSMLDRQLRLAFWDEYFLTQDNAQKHMRMEAVYGRICSREMFYTIVDSEIRYAWLLTPPEQYTYKMRALLDIGLERMLEVLQLPMIVEKINPKTKVPYKVIDSKIVGEIIKAVAILDNRVRGAVPQHIRIQSEQRNLNVNMHSAIVPDREIPQTHQGIESELAKVQKQIDALREPNNVLGNNAVPKVEGEHEILDVTPRS
jgi:hypothetical protein